MGDRCMRRIFVTLLAFALTAPSSPPSHPSIGEALAAIRAFAPRAMAEQGTPGLSVAITERNRTLAIITLGYADVAARTPVTPQTRFAIGSITKSMTALALLQLRDAHRLDLDAPVTRYLPWFSIHSGGRPILVHQILSHTAGLPDDYSATPSYTYGIAALRETHTIFTPGTSWSYSNDGFAVVGALLATLDHRTWAASLQARVLDPLEMSDTSPVFTPETMATAAVGYEFRDADRPPPVHPPLVASRPFDFVDPAGSVLSTPGDMARYLRFFLDRGVVRGKALLSRATFDAMTSPDRYNDGKLAGSTTVMLAEAPQYYRKYGFGLSIFYEHGDHLIGHTGGISGYTACMQANLTRGFGVVAMANLVEAPLHPCAIVLYAMRVLRAQQLGDALPQPPPPPDPARVAQAHDYTGTYTALNGRTFSVAAAGNRLSMIDRGISYTLYPRGPGLFWSSDPRYPLFLFAFGRNAKHRVDQATYGSVWFGNARYKGPRSWSYPQRWNAYIGRFENVFWGSPAITRVLVVKGTLTFDGLEPIVPQKNGSFLSGTDVVRFDTPAGGKMQRMIIDDYRMYRIELP
jgi:D-alanyl-D-alanine carboxypeptidase